ncbi:MAG: MATE family efflux transporter [Spirochaetales bacterium]|nr:MATE family efflux transporter [Spirochaetales bacterium]
MDKEQNTSQRTAFLGTQAIFPLILKMGIPAAVAMIVNALYNIVDTMFVGHGVGPLAIAALSIVFPIQMIVSAVAQALGVGAASIVSRRLGEKREKEAASAIGTAYTAIFIVTALMIFLVMLFMKDILVFFGASESIMPYAQEYLGTIGPGFFFFAAGMAASNLVRAEGNARASMTGMIIGAVCNLILDPVFIFGLGMGVRGAALATVFSQLLTCVYLFSLYLTKKTHIPLTLGNFRIKKAILGEAAVLGAPAFIQAAGMSVLALVINKSLGHYGGDVAISIYGTTHRLLSLIIFPILGIVQGFQPIVGYNYGAKHYDRVKKALYVAVLTVFSLATFFYILVMAFPQISMSLFSSDQNFIAASARVLRVMAFFIPLAAVQITGATYFQAIGKKTESLMLGLSRQFLILIPLVLLMPFLMGVDGIWFSFPVADLVSTCITIFLLLGELKKLRIMSTPFSVEKVSGITQEGPDFANGSNS